jgi:primosomal protein N' (replication factor Y)
MKSGAADILIGTQMIAKGHDLPGVTLVGVINADVGLHMPDFRSSEKTFQLITQAAGRAGRAELPGRVLVQTREPNHPTIVAIASGRFKAFARYELDYRKQLEYPPHGKLLRIIVSSEQRDDLAVALRKIETLLKHLTEHAHRQPGGEKLTMRTLGPAVAPYEKLRGRYRVHFLVKANSSRVLSWLARSLRQWRQTQPATPDFRIAVDLDPVDMM